MQVTRLLPAALVALGTLAGPGAWAHPAHEPQPSQLPQDLVVPVVGGVQRASVDAGTYYFRPRRLVVRLNIPVELVVKTDGSATPHDWVMQSPEAGMAMRERLSGAPTTIRFTPTALGSYAFYCSKKVPMMKSHRERGMEGVVEVVP